MDNPVIGSLMGTTKTNETSKKTDKGDAGAFSSAMNDAVQSGGGGKEGVIDDKAAPDKDDKAKKGKEDAKEAAKAEAKVEAKPEQLKGGAKLQAYLETLAYKDPSTMSTAERQAFKLGEFSMDKVGLSELQKMLLGKGINLKDLSYSQLTQLTNQTDRNQLSRLIDSLLREADGKEQKTSNEQLAASGNTNAGGRLEQMLAEEAMKTREAGKSGEAQRAEQRQNLMDQILAHVEVRNLANQTELNLKLNPEYLGDVKISLIHDEKGIRADFQTTSRATRELLEESEEELLSQVKSKGIRLEAMRVKLVEEVV